MSHTPTIEQAALIDHENDSIFVKACPGAGKTKTIVHRVKRQLDLKISADRRGIAMLSFTNSAVDEFTDRCVKVQIASELKYPNFVGTFDSFMWRFIFLPIINPMLDVKPRLIESWDKKINLPYPKNIKGQGVSLGQFNLSTLKFQLEETDPVRSVVMKYEQDYVQAAKKCLDGFNRKGLFSTNDMRQIIFERLNDLHICSSLGAILKGRFKEVVIDEAQDCNEVDIFVIKWLKESGIHVIIVCDPDQAIYEFRNSTPEKLIEFTTTLKEIKLTSNFRCAPMISKLASTLRKDLSVDESKGEFGALVEPIRIVPYSGRTVCNSVGVKFLSTANSLGISSSEICSLAHDRKSAMRAAGLNPPDSNSNSKRFRLAEAVVNFKNLGASWRYREKALITIMQLILECEGLFKDGDVFQQVLIDNMLEERILRRRALELINNLPDCCEEGESEAWIEQAKRNFGKGVRLAPGTSINTLFRSAPEWSKPLAQKKLSGQVMLHSTVHEAKGREYLGVLLSIKPGSNVLDLWSKNTIAEELRVLYVGITRAKRLLGLAIHQNKLAELKNILDGHEIAYQIDE